MIVATILSNGNAATIEAAVRSACAACDLVVIVDTGIEDETKEIAQLAGGDKVKFRTIRWENDFAAARNACLRIAGGIGANWCLHLDSDEILHGVLQLGDDPRIDCYLIADASGTYYRERLIRVNSAARWQGRTHETLQGVPPEKRRTLTGVTIEGRPKTKAQFADKLVRDLELLTAMTCESPQEPRWWYYLGQTYEDLGHVADAIDAFRMCLKLPGWSEQAAWSAYRAAVCLARQQRYQDAIDVCVAGMKRDARFPELAWYAGWNCYQLGRYADAVHWARTAQSIVAAGTCNTRIGFRFLPGWKERPADLLAWSKKQLAAPSARPNIIVLGVGHSNTTITVQQLHALGWHAADADCEFAESVAVRTVNHQLLTTGQFLRRAAASALPLATPWAIKDPRFAYGCLHHWLPVFERDRPLLLWITKNSDQVRASFASRGESCDRLDEWLAYCQQQFDAWPWAKLHLDAAHIAAACELWQGVSRGN